ncbi:MAG: hypothetical protein GWN01_12005 [Nitrosopumilaceae archaeon]|nr:hypothetical protein [Nitrosopumilaceae archaeon]NIU01600.1 hypothetical protein [Nitrosopumilaceae archaeon]NIU88019.1 hypothetical protein [Nitrosopumilaceae archaeon]NIV66286.1 hypothetical protein [Nitrosopumilaceae archaeon]NIX62202.1 hypothetical protein [Nitrosopumilaceae archaeon]
MDVSEITSDPFWKLIFERFDDKNIQQSKGVLKRAKTIQKLYIDTIKEYFNMIIQMSDKDFEKLLSKRKDEAKRLQEIISEKMKSMSHSTKTEELATFAILPELGEEMSNEIEKKISMQKITKSNFERLFGLEFLARIELFNYIIVGLIGLDTRDRIESILEKHFDNNFNWAYAVSVLAIQENMVKQKLTELGMTKIQIKKFLKEKGNNFSNLIDLLAEKIREKEKRKVRLRYYRSGTIRELRNKIEHEGFDVKVDDADVRDLLNDIESFEKELYPK